MKTKSINHKKEVNLRSIEKLKFKQLKFLEYTVPNVKPSKREKLLIKKLNKMRFYPLEKIKKKLISKSL